MGLFGKSFKEKVEEAVEKIRGMNLGVRNLSATIDGKVVTLLGETDSMEVKTKVMTTFNEMVETDNTLNTVKVVRPVAPPPVAPPLVEAPPAPVEERVYEVVHGDTLGAIAKRFYDKAGLYMKIFEANRDILDNPDRIKVGQKLRIPE